jgi:hypothetical protein
MWGFIFMPLIHLKGTVHKHRNNFIFFFYEDQTGCQSLCPEGGHLPMGYEVSQKTSSTLSQHTTFRTEETLVGESQLDKCNTAAGGNTGKQNLFKSITYTNQLTTCHLASMKYKFLLLPRYYEKRNKRIFAYFYDNNHDTK